MMGKRIGGLLAAVAVFLLSFVVLPAPAHAIGECPMGSNPYPIGADFNATKFRDLPDDAEPWATTPTRPLPEWFGYATPQILSSFVKVDEGVVNPAGDACSGPGDLNAFMTQKMPSFALGVVGAEAEVSSYLTDARESSDGITKSIRERTAAFNEVFGNGLFGVLIIGVVLAAIAGALWYVIRGRHTKALQELLFIVAAAFIAGLVLGGAPGVVRDTIEGFGNDVSALAAQEVADTSGADKFATANGVFDPCLADLPRTTGEQFTCQQWRDGVWVPYVFTNFGGSNAYDYLITDESVDLIINSAQSAEDYHAALVRAMDRTREMFGDKAAHSAPILQYVILNESYNQAVSGLPANNDEETRNAIMGLTYAIDRQGEDSATWAKDWAGQGAASAWRPIDTIITLIFAGIPGLLVVFLNFFLLVGVWVLEFFPVVFLFAALAIAIERSRAKGIGLFGKYFGLVIFVAFFTVFMSVAGAIAVYFSNLFSSMYGPPGLFMYLATVQTLALAILCVLSWLFLVPPKMKRKLSGSAKAVAAAGANAVAPGSGALISGGLDGAIDSATGKATAAIDPKTRARIESDAPAEEAKPSEEMLELIDVARMQADTMAEMRDMMAEQRGINEALYAQILSSVVNDRGDDPNTGGATGGGGGVGPIPPHLQEAVKAYADQAADYSSPQWASAYREMADMQATEGVGPVGFDLANLNLSELQTLKGEASKYASEYGASAGKPSEDSSRRYEATLDYFRRAAEANASEAKTQQEEHLRRLFEGDSSDYAREYSDPEV